MLKCTCELDGPNCQACFRSYTQNGGMSYTANREENDLWSRTERQAEGAERRRGWAEAFRNPQWDEE